MLEIYFYSGQEADYRVDLWEDKKRDMIAR
jgi:hypothetical protein